MGKNRFIINIDEQDPAYTKNTWEYKDIYIRRPYKRLDSKGRDYGFMEYMEFNEDNGLQWYYVLDNENNICKNLSSILNFFGNRGWELISIKQSNNFEGDPTDDYHCIFKRKKR